MISVAKPPRRLSMLPVLDGGDLLHRTLSGVPSILDVGTPLILNRGSEAIRLALLHAGICPGDEVLIPAYNCPSMVVPIYAVGATPVFYPLTRDLAIDSTEITRLHGSKTRALIAAHFFGALQSLKQIRLWCDERSVALIEDCSHAMYGSLDGQPIGSTGDYAVASPRKFLPIVEGGLLTSSRFSLDDVNLGATSYAPSFRVAFDSLQIATLHGRLTLALPIVWICTLLRTLSKRGGVPKDDRCEAPDGLDLSPGKAAAWITRRMLAFYASGDSLLRRRENYLRLANQISEIPGFSVFLPAGQLATIPYVVPVLLQRPEVQFAELKRRGVPVWRWENSRHEHCAVTAAYNYSLVQLPCHQSLDDTELNWIIHELRAMALTGDRE
jgi:perosamine synthetase